MIRSAAWIMLSIAIVSNPGQVEIETETGSRPPIDVYLLGGQSNMVGRGTFADLPTSIKPNPRAWLFHSTWLKSTSAPLTWAPLRPASEELGKFGPEIGFGNRMQQLTKDRPIALIKHGLTSTELKWSWSPGKDPDDLVNIGRQFKVFDETVNAGLKALREQGFEPTLRGMIWQQGETDATEVECAREYLQNFCRLIPRFREQFHAPDLVFVYGFVLPPPNNQPYREIVRTVQGAVDQDSGAAWAIKNASSSLPTTCCTSTSTPPSACRGMPSISARSGRWNWAGGWPRPCTGGGNCQSKRQANSSGIGVPLRTMAMGRPVLVLYSLRQSMPRA